MQVENLLKFDVMVILVTDGVDATLRLETKLLGDFLRNPTL